VFNINESEQFRGIAGLWVKRTVHNFSNYFIPVCSPLFFRVQFLPTFMELSFPGKNTSKNRLACNLPKYPQKRNFRPAQLWNSELYTLIVSGKKITVCLMLNHNKFRLWFKKNSAQMRNQLAWHVQGVSLVTPELHNAAEEIHRGSPNSIIPRSSMLPCSSASPRSSSKSCAMSRLFLLRDG